MMAITTSTAMTTTKNMEILFGEIVWRVYRCMCVCKCKCASTDIIVASNTYMARLNSIDLGNKMHTLNKYIVRWTTLFSTPTQSHTHTHIDTHKRARHSDARADEKKCCESTRKIFMQANHMENGVNNFQYYYQIWFCFNCFFIFRCECESS